MWIFMAVLQRYYCNYLSLSSSMSVATEKCDWLRSSSRYVTSHPWFTFSSWSNEPLRSPAASNDVIIVARDRTADGTVAKVVVSHLQSAGLPTCTCRWWSCRITWTGSAITTRPLYVTGNESVKLPFKMWFASARTAFLVGQQMCRQWNGMQG